MRDTKSFQLLKRTGCALMALAVMLVASGCRKSGGELSEYSYYTVKVDGENDEVASSLDVVNSDSESSKSGTAENVKPNNSVGGGKYDVLNNSTKGLSFEDLGLPKLKITNKKVKYLCWHDKSKLSDPKETFYQTNMLMQKYYGCQLEFITTTYEELPTKAAQMVLSGQSPDIIFYKSADNPGFIYNKIVQPIDSHVDVNNKYIKPYLLDQHSVNGKHYFLGTVINNGRVYYWKQNFIDIGEKTPLELYKAGKWTWSKFLDLAKKLTVDSNADGKPEVYGCNLDVLYSFTSCGEDFVKFNSDGTTVNNLKGARIAKAMNFFYQLGKKGENVKGGTFNNKTCVMFWEEAWRVGSYSEYYKNGTVEYAPSPKMDGSDKYYVPGRLSTDWLSAGAPNPGGAIAYFVCTKLLTDNDQISKQFENIVTDQIGLSDEMLKLNEELKDSSKFVPVITRMEGVGNWSSKGMWALLDDVAAGTPWTTCLETYYPVFQAEIETANSLAKKLK